MKVLFKEWAIALIGQFSQEFLLVHAVLESFTSVDEDDRNFVIVLAAQFGVGVHVNLLPSEASAAGEFGKTFFDDLTQVAALAGVDHNVVSLWHVIRF